MHWLALIILLAIVLLILIAIIMYSRTETFTFYLSLDAARENCEQSGLVEACFNPMYADKGLTKQIGTLSDTSVLVDGETNRWLGYAVMKFNDNNSGNFQFVVEGEGSNRKWHLIVTDNATSFKRGRGEVVDGVIKMVLFT